MRSSPDAWAIIVAAGAARRFGGDIPKQFERLAGKPMVMWSVEAFQAHSRCAGIVLVVPEEYSKRPPDWLAALGEGGVRLVAGGPERTDSVRLGLEAVDESAKIVAVHDGARPMITAGVVTRVLEGVGPGRGAIAGRRVADTLKAVSGRRVIRTIGREGLWRAETPQAFPREMIAAAYRRASEEDVAASDCAALCEQYGMDVVVVEIEEPNLKVTTRGDFELAYAWLERRERDRRSDRFQG